MRRLRRRLGALTLTARTLTAMAALATAGCTQTVDGSAQRGRPAVPDPDRSYGYVEDRCGLLQDDSVKDMLRAESIVRAYVGAVCQYVAATPSGLVDVVFSWFDTGSLARERALAEERGSRITDKDVVRHSAFLAQRPGNAAACAGTAAAGPGVVSWWVQYRPQTGDDPCATAERLLTATLSADL